MTPPPGSSIRPAREQGERRFARPCGPTGEALRTDLDVTASAAPDVPPPDPASRPSSDPTRRQNTGRPTRPRQRFRDWRGGRPFWAGLLTLSGALPIAWSPYTTLTLGHLTIAMATPAGAGSLIIGVLLVTLGLTMWFRPAVRVFAGGAAIVLALVSLVVSNFGGYLIGFTLALIGGALSLSWAPVSLRRTGRGIPGRPGCPCGAPTTGASCGSGSSRGR
ncbi:DUF6114 domain-containing protein [Streptomyces sp. WMMC905]|uniref:DUF6114 domain-containing protein n=1 Tax=Streptomyces sp. WMMC905 TaxID=3404123 RepID=UPI003B93558E